MTSSHFRRPVSEYGVAIVHALFATSIIAAAIVHVGRVSTGAEPHIGLLLLGVFIAFGIFSALSLAFPAKMRDMFFGLFATLILANTINDLTRWGFIQHLWASYSLEFATFLVSGVCLGISLGSKKGHITKGINLADAYN